MLLHYLHYDYIDVTGVIGIVMDIWGDRHASACNPSFLSIVLLSHARSHKAATSIIHLQSAGLSLFGDSSKSFSAMYQFPAGFLLQTVQTNR